MNARRTIALSFFSCIALSACGVDTTGLSARSSRTIKGSETVAVTVTEYGDFQCPACGSAYAIINLPLEKKYADKIRFEFKHFPLREIHQYAYEASMAAECAADQGKFWEFLDMDYVHQKDLSSDTLRTWGAALGLNADLFDRCIRSEIKGATVMADEAEGEKLGVQGTPAYFVNGERVKISSLEALSAAIDEALLKAKSTPL